VVVGGDWNTVFSCIPIPGNPDVFNMAGLPNPTNSRKVNKMCEMLKLTDPFRILYPHKIDFSYAPWGNLRKNRSRLDFFLVSESIIPLVEDCSIKPCVQSRLFDHKAVLLNFKKKKAPSSRPTISGFILRDPDIELIVKTAAYECYVQNSVNENFKQRNLNRIGRIYKLIRDAGPDSSCLEYSYANLLEDDHREAIMQEIRRISVDLDLEDITEAEHGLPDDIFLDYLVNNIRNKVISYQSFISKKLNESYDNLIEKLTELKGNVTQNSVLISECELKLREINEIRINAILSKNPNFAQLNSERIMPFFLKMARGSSLVNSMWEICDDEGKKFNSICEQKAYIRDFFANSFKKPDNEQENLDCCTKTFLGPEILDHPLTRIHKLSDDERIRSRLI
jgi:hypothetical protein